MSDGRATRNARIAPFIDRLGLDRQGNLKSLIDKAQMLKQEGFEQVAWEQTIWKITGGRLIKITGKNTTTVSLNFTYSPTLGGEDLRDDWSNVTKSLFALRFHRKNQSTTNQRNFITAVGYVAYSADKLGLKLSTLTPEALDSACNLVSGHYSDGVAYNLHKAIAEFAGHCDANQLCRIMFKYKYARMKRPKNVGGVGHKRLDDPSVAETKSDKLVDPLVFKIIGELYQKVPRDHKYRFYVLMLSLMAFIGRRFSEISLLPYQEIKQDIDGREYIEYFPRKMSQGDLFTPWRKLYMPSEVLPLVRDVIQELDTLCAEARETAEEMHRVKGADLRFLFSIDESKRFYKEDLEELGISPVVLDKNGWIRKNNFSFVDIDKLTIQGIKPANPSYYTNKEGIAVYCRRDYLSASTAVIHIDQNSSEYFLKDLLLVRHLGLSSGTYTHWVSTQCTHSMMTTFLRYFPALAKEYAHASIEVDFTSHHFRHTLNTLLDEGGLSDLLQTEWFGRSNQRDTKAYQHTSREKRALMLRKDIKNGRVGGQLAEQIKVVPVGMQDALLKARVNAVHDVGTGICIHNFAQTPCERHLQCAADCKDYVWAKDDKGRLDEQKRQYALTVLARETAEQNLNSQKPRKSSDWLVHNDKKLKTLSTQLADNGIVDFDPIKYLEELNNG